MDEHKRLIQEYVNKVACSKNSKVLSKDKYDKIVNHLIESANGDPKFRWWVEKKRGYKLMNFAELGLNDVLCVPAKNEVRISLSLSLSLSFKAYMFRQIDIPIFWF